VAAEEPRGLPRCGRESRQPLEAEELQNVVFGRYADRRLMIARSGAVTVQKHLERATRLKPEPISRRRGQGAG